ncbi:MAG: Zn(2+)-responsive transcriptional regulator [Calditrichia bacterium]
MAKMKIGQLAKISGVNLETIRFYEKRGLLPEPQRSAGGYRLYDEEDLLRLRFIRRAKDLGFTLKEIGELLELRIESTGTCGEVKHLAEHKIQDVERKIQYLQRIRTVLNRLINQCVNEEITAEECPILEAIEHD